MYLHDVFSAEFIKVDLEAEDKDEAFEELADYYCHVSKQDVRENVLEALRTREAKMSTGIQKGIAIPHGTADSVSDVCGVLGISRKGIDYDALDGEPVYLLFMVVAPHSETERHLKILKQLAALIDTPQFHIDLQSQRDAQGAYKVIRKYEDMLAVLG